LLRRCLSTSFSVPPGALLLALGGTCPLAVQQQVAA
jgi:hypothetical protein